METQRFYRLKSVGYENKMWSRLNNNSACLVSTIVRSPNKRNIKGWIWSYLRQREEAAEILPGRCLRFKQMSLRPWNKSMCLCVWASVCVCVQDTNGMSQLAAEECCTEGLVWLAGMWRTPSHIQWTSSQLSGHCFLQFGSISTTMHLL